LHSPVAHIEGQGMSRMFSALSGSGASRPVAESQRPSATLAAPLPDASEQAPFLEIGGPDGPVFSLGSALRSEVPAPSPESESEPSQQPEASPQIRAFPRLARPAYLSVTFHDLAGRTEAAEVDGPDAGLVALHFPDHAISGEYRTLRDEIRAQLPEPVPRIVMLAAAAGESGTTTVLLNLAITLARENGPRVLVVDANWARPAIPDRLAAKPTTGLAEVLAQQIPLAWAVQPTVVPNLQVLSAGGEGTAAISIAEELPKLIGQFRQWYDWVLIDAGVWGTMPERDAACPSVDAVYLVSRSQDVTRGEFAGLRKSVRESGGLLRGYITTVRV
jgi:Mrp family chromosome partitioning ATPase